MVEPDPMRVTLFTILILFSAVLARAQDIRVSATASTNKILIGEPIQLELEAELPSNALVGWFKLDSIPHFQFIQVNNADTLQQVNTQRIKQLITITSFDSGSQVIPSFTLLIGNSRYATDSIPVEVGYSEMDPNQPYHDIKDLIDVPEADNNYINYIIAAVSLLALGVLIWLLRRKKRTAVAAAAPQQIVLGAFEQARESLKALKAANLPANGQHKQFFVELNDILRIYLRKKQIVTAPDASNDTVVMKLQSDLSRDQTIALAQTLRLADAVKFARYQPEIADQDEAFEVVSKTIPIIEEVHYKNRKA